jgi:DNA repair photolyase
MEKAATGTREWASSNVNIVKGCSHGCWYCYARVIASRFGRIHGPADWLVETVKPVRKRFGKRRGVGRVMFPSSHDITPNTVGPCSETLRGLLSAGNEVLVVSKPHLSVIKRLTTDLARWRDRVLFRFTIGSERSNVLAVFEPGAPTYAERLAALRHAYEDGYATSVSMEPMLTEHPEVVIKAVRPYVTDCVWLGLLNGVETFVTLNKCPPDVAAAARQVRQHWSPDRVRQLYATWHADPMVKWKESIKKIVGVELATECGLDV